MTFRGIKILVLFALLSIYSSDAIAESRHYVFQSNPYKNKYRTAILKAAGFIRENPDKTFTFLREGPLVAKPVSCKFTVNKTGEIASLEILKSSGDKAVDQAALVLIRKAAPFSFEQKNQSAQIVRFGPPNADVIVVSEEEDRQ